MKRWNILLGALLSALLITSAQAGSFGLGGAASIASISANGTETEGTSGSETENSVMTATAGNEVAFASIYAEYAFGDGENFVLGVEHIPGSADINSETLSRTDASQGSYTAVDTGTLKANAEISKHTTYYVELGQGATGMYGKIGFAQVDIDVKQNNAAGYGTYPDKTLDAVTYALGYKAGFGESGVIKIEGFMTDYDSYSATSTTSNTVAANLDVVGAKLSIGLRF